MTSEAKDVVKNWKRKRVIPLPECQLGWCVVEIVEVDPMELKSGTGMLYLPTGKESAMQATASAEQQKGVHRFFVRATHKQFQCNSTTIADTPFEVGDEVLIEIGPHVRVRTENHAFVLPERHMSVRIENICNWQKVKMAAKPEPAQ